MRPAKAPSAYSESRNASTCARASVQVAWDVALEQHPARAALDAGHDEQRQAARRQVTPVADRGGAAGQRARAGGELRRDAHRLQQIDAGIDEPRAVGVLDIPGGPQARPQDGVVAFGGRPDRPGFVAARDHAGGHAAGREQSRSGRAAGRRPRCAERTWPRLRCGTASGACRRARPRSSPVTTADRR